MSNASLYILGISQMVALLLSPMSLLADELEVSECSLIEKWHTVVIRGKQ